MDKLIKDFELPRPPRANTSKETCISNYKNDYMQWDRLSKLGVIIQYWKKTPACMIVLLWSIMKDFGNQRVRFLSRIYHCYRSIYETVFMNTNMIYETNFKALVFFYPLHYSWLREMVNLLRSTTKPFTTSAHTHYPLLVAYTPHHACEPHFFSKPSPYTVFFLLPNTNWTLSIY